MSALDSLRHHPALSTPSKTESQKTVLKGATGRSVHLAQSHLMLAQKHHKENPSERTLSVIQAAQAHLQKVRFGR